MFKRLVAIAVLSTPTAASAADDLHRRCNLLIENAYRGQDLARGDVAKVNGFLFELVRKKRISLEQKEAIDTQLLATDEAISSLINELAAACASAANSPE